MKTEKDQIGQLQGEKVSLEVKAAEAEEQREGMFKFRLFLYARLKNGRIMLYPLASVCPSVCPSVRL